MLVIFPSFSLLWEFCLSTLFHLMTQSLGNSAMWFEWHHIHQHWTKGFGSLTFPVILSAYGTDNFYKFMRKWNFHWKWKSRNIEIFPESKAHEGATYIFLARFFLCKIFLWWKVTWTNHGMKLVSVSHPKSRTCLCCDKSVCLTPVSYHVLFEQKKWLHDIWKH